MPDNTRSLAKLANLVALPHSVFALPFALASLAISWRRGATASLPSHGSVTAGLVVLAVVAARTAAMAFNRLADHEIDARNPRTAGRELPSGTLSRSAAWLLTLAAVGVFVGSAAALGRHCLVMSPIVLVVLFGYSLTKRFTSASHLVLGIALGLAPAGAWWVVRPEVAITPVLLSLAVVLWVAGFDIVYSCQDVDFDRAQGLHSLPAALGAHKALAVSRWLHLGSFLLLVLAGLSAALRWPYYFALGLQALPLMYQHRIVSASDLKRVDRAFFTSNGALSLLYLSGVLFALA